MEDQSENILPKIPAVEAVPEEPSEVFPVLEAVEVAVGMEEKPLYAGDSGGDHGGMPTAIVGSGGSGESELVGKRKRGRPRKQSIPEAEQELMAKGAYSAPPQKRGRGRPKGSGGSEKTASGIKFTPVVLSIQTGENIVQRLLSFSQCTPDSLCIFSASGTISSVDMFQPCLRGGIVRYEMVNSTIKPCIIVAYTFLDAKRYGIGRFDIISLKGSHTYGDNGGQLQKKSLLSVQFVDAEGTFFGGAVAGSLIAAGPTQVIVATFNENQREQVKVRHRVEAPKPSKGPTSLHMQLENDNLTDANVQGAPVISHVDGINAHASLQPSDWNSSQPSMLGSEFVMPDVGQGVGNP